MISQKQQQKQQQKLLPQQIMLMKLLQTPAMALEETIKQEIEKNPVLEEVETNQEEFSPEKEECSDPVDEIDMDDYFHEEEYTISSEKSTPSFDNSSVFSSSEESFQEFLITQMGWQKMTETENIIGLELIGNLDDAGYLSRSPKAITHDMILRYNLSVSEEEVLKVLQVIQSFDPPGIGAQSLQECLLLQLKRIEPQSPITNISIRIIQETYDLFTRKHYEKIIQRLGISKEEITSAIDLIVKLNPKPSGGIPSATHKNSLYIIPDFYLYNINGELEFSLNNSYVPNLQLSTYYINLMQGIMGDKKSSKNKKETVQFIKKQVDSAKWFMDAVKQRQITLQRTFSAIVEYQHAFFLEGDINKLAPMRLKDITLKTGYDISTISRVVNQKYVQTHFGTFLLKDFFSTSYTDDKGNIVATDTIKQTLAESIEKEDKNTPLSDEELTHIMKEKGYPIARRTITKYREALKIPVARLRKKI